MKKFLLFIMAVSSAISLSAAYIRNFPVDITQPDGQDFVCYVTGDEYYNWLHDAENYTLVRDNEGWYCYASLIEGKLASSGLRLGHNSPSEAGLSPGINITSERILEMRNAVLASTPKKPGALSNPKSAGTINNLVIFIRFAGEAEFTDNISVYDDMFVNVAGNNSMKNYFEEVSYNTLHINSSYYPLPGATVLSYQAPLTRDYYMPWDAFTNPNGYFDQADAEHQLLEDAVNAVSSQVPGGLDIDYDNDGYVDNICFIVSGSTTAWSTLLWPHRWALYSQNVYINGKQVWDYNLQVRNHLISNGVGVLCHEMFHTLGSPDLYHYNSDGLTPVGTWDIMESNQNPPQQMGAFMKYRYGGWIPSIPVISAPGTYTLNPLTSATGNCYRINSPYSSSEYFVVEYRRDIGVFESSLPGSGILVYRINTDFDGMGNAGYDGSSTLDEVYIYRPYGEIAVNGQIQNANFSSNVNRKKINDATNPSSFLSSGMSGGLNISNITSSGNTISFDLNGGPSCTINPGVESIISPSSFCGLSASSIVGVLIKNYGTQTIGAGLNLSYAINGGTPVTESYSGAPINAGTTTQFYFTQTADFSMQGNYSIQVVCGLSGDCTTSNDTLMETVTNGYLGYSSNDAQIISGTYTDLGTNGTLISTADFDDANSAPQNIGFTFYFDCQAFTQLILNTNGFIRLGSSPPSSAALFFSGAQVSTGGVFNSEDPADVNIIAAFNHDLMAGAQTPEYRISTSGVSPNRKCTIQFENLRDKTSSPAQQYDNIDFQIILYESTNNIDFVYGDWEGSASPSDYKTSAVGLKGPGPLYGQVLIVRKSSGADWGNAIFDNANYFSTATLNFGNPPNRPVPDIGTIYRFIWDQVITSAVDNNVAEKVEEALLLWPNPSSETINIRFPKPADQNASLQITDMTGRIVYSKENLSAGSTQISVNMLELSPGLYAVTFIREGTVYSGRFVKE